MNQLKMLVEMEGGKKGEGKKVHQHDPNLRTYPHYLHHMPWSSYERLLNKISFNKIKTNNSAKLRTKSKNAVLKYFFWCVSSPKKFILLYKINLVLKDKNTLRDLILRFGV